MVSRRALCAFLLASGAGLGTIATSAEQSLAAAPLRQTALVAWKGGDYRGHARAGFTVPGIGEGRIVCRRNMTWIRVTPRNKSAETQMWTTKYQPGERGELVTSVQNARVYRYAQPRAAFDKTSGSSAYARFNQVRGVEDASHGRIRGLISQRPGRNARAQAAQTPPPTMFTLSYRWRHFHKARARSTCTVHATFMTRIRDRAKRRRAQRTRRIGTTVRLATNLTMSGGTFDWHGESDARRTDRDFPLYGYGQIRITCEPGDEDGVHMSIFTYADADPSRVWLAMAEGSGPDAVAGEDYPVNPVSGGTVRIDLPKQGMSFGNIHTRGRNGPIARLVVSTYAQMDNADPRLNLCEVAVALSGPELASPL